MHVWQVKVHKTGSAVKVFDGDNFIREIKASADTFEPMEAKEFGTALLTELNEKSAKQMENTEAKPEVTTKAELRNEVEKVTDAEPKGIAVKDASIEKAAAKITQLRGIIASLKSKLAAERTERTIERKARRGLAIAKQLVANGSLKNEYEAIRNKVAEITDLDDAEISREERKASGEKEFDSPAEARKEARRMKRIARINRVAAEDAQEDNDEEAADDFDAKADEADKKANYFEQVAVEMEKAPEAAPAPTATPEVKVEAKKTPEEKKEEKKEEVKEEKAEAKAEEKKEEKKEEAKEAKKVDKKQAAAKYRKLAEDHRKLAEDAEAAGDSAEADKQDEMADEAEDKAEEIESCSMDEAQAEPEMKPEADDIQFGSDDDEAEDDEEEAKDEGKVAPVAEKPAEEAQADESEEDEEDDEEEDEDDEDDEEAQTEEGKAPTAKKTASPLKRAHDEKVIDGFGFDKNASLVEENHYSNDTEVEKLSSMWRGAPQD